MPVVQSSISRSNTPTSMDKITLSRKELYDLIWSEPMLSISRRFKISDRGLGKVCNRMKFPHLIPGTGGIFQIPEKKGFYS